MSTHNIGFYEDLTKIIFELSSSIIKYAPYFFCWKTQISQAFTKSVKYHQVSSNTHLISSAGRPRSVRHSPSLIRVFAVLNG